MATEVAPPIEAPPFSIETWQKDEDAYTEKLRAAARWANDGEYVGEIVKWQRADGYAVYMVWSERPLQIMHVALGDGYTVEPSLIRGLTLAEVKKQVEWERSWRRASTEPNEIFYGSVKPDDIVHYSNGFAQFVRCKVVSDSTGIQGVKLLPIALVGEVGRRQDENGRWIHGWNEWDLVRRLNTGEPHWGHHAKQIIEETRFQPHASNIYEYSDRLQREGPDPRTMEPISLDPPPMTDDEAEAARLARVLYDLKGRIEGVDKSDVSAMTEALGTIAATALNAVSG
jgi:hypothetical protein